MLNTRLDLQTPQDTNSKFVSYDTKVIGTHEAPTLQQFTAYQAAFDYFNNVLFDKKVPKCILSLNNHIRTSYGYFRTNAWTNNSNEVVHEINLSQAHLSRPAEKVYGTLVHEMCHALQKAIGSPSRSGYHNKEFAQIMENVGLICSDTGQIGGARVGQRISHYILENGKFQVAFNQLDRELILPFLPYEKTIAYTPIPSLVEPNRKAIKSNRKIKYTCPNSKCKNAVWGKPGMSLMCKDHDTDLIEIG